MHAVDAELVVQVRSGGWNPVMPTQPTVWPWPTCRPSRIPAKRDMWPHYSVLEVPAVLQDHHSTAAAVLPAARNADLAVACRGAYGRPARRRIVDTAVRTHRA